MTAMPWSAEMKMRLGIENLCEIGGLDTAAEKHRRLLDHRFILFWEFLFGQRRKFFWFAVD